MTLAEIEKLPNDMLTPEIVGKCIGIGPQAIRDQATGPNPDKLGFPVIVVGSRVRIPKEGLLHFCRYGCVKPTQYIYPPGRQSQWDEPKRE